MIKSMLFTVRLVQWSVSLTQYSVLRFYFALIVELQLNENFISKCLQNLRVLAHHQKLWVTFVKTYALYIS